jgi:hypothetical protein
MWPLNDLPGVPNLSRSLILASRSFDQPLKEALEGRKWDFAAVRNNLGEWLILSVADVSESDRRALLTRYQARRASGITSSRSSRQKSGRTVAVDHRVEERDIGATSCKELCAGDGRVDIARTGLAFFGGNDLGGDKQLAQPRDVDVGEALDSVFTGSGKSSYSDAMKLDRQM